MILMHDAPLFRIYFGNASDNIYSKMYLNSKTPLDFTSMEPFTKTQKMLLSDNLFFLNQIHSADGMEANQDILSSVPPFVQKGDYLITQQRTLGIGVMSADCLPIIAYDPTNNAIGIAHAGWRGSIQSIGISMVKHMKQKYDTKVEQLLIFFGPSAKVCCYEVKHEFKNQLENFPFADQTLQYYDDGTFFDLPLFNQLQLELIGIQKEAFQLNYNICTICDTNYCSYRRDGSKAGRQMTIVNLK